MRTKFQWPTRFIAPVLVVLISYGICFAQETIRVETISGTNVSGSLEKIAEDGSLIGEGLDDINLQQVLSLSTQRSGASPPGDAVELKLVDGGQLFVSNPMIDGENVQFESSLSEFRSVPVQAVRAIVLKSNDMIRDAVAKPATDQDTIIVDRGESLARVSGVLELLDADKLQLNFGGKSRPINREKVAAVVVADLGLDAPTGTLVTVSLTDGSTVRGALRSFEKDSFSLELTGDTTIKFLRKHLVGLAVDSDSIAFLSALTPVEVRQQPQFTVTRQWRRNTSVEGNPIRLQVASDRDGESSKLTTFDNGIGTSSYSRLVFENTKEFTRFLATVGIDAETDGRGDCELRVEGDGITLWSQRVRGSDVATIIDVDITGIKQVALIVEPGEQFDLADHVDWARARFLKTE